MKGKTVETQLLDFFRTHSSGEFASGWIQRQEWFNKNGTLATPRSVVRRLQELAEEGKIHQTGTIQSAKYSLNIGVVKPKMKQVIEQLPDNTVRITYIPI